MVGSRQHPGSHDTRKGAETSASGSKGSQEKVVFQAARRVSSILDKPSKPTPTVIHFSNKATSIPKDHT